MLLSSIATKPKFVATLLGNLSASRQRMSYVINSVRSIKPGFTTRITQITAINPNAINAGMRLAGLNVTQSRKQKNQSDTRQLWFEKRIEEPYWPALTTASPPGGGGVPTVGET